LTNRWFFDTELNEDGRTIDLISIGMVSEDGRKYYAVSSEFDKDRCHRWVKQNVLPFIDGHTVTPRAEIARQILETVGDKPEFWAYFADYDWVVLCQLYGRMIDLPKGFPFWCRDLKQLMEERGVKKEQLPPQSGTEHEALEDASWVREAYLWIQAWAP
jgi:hypothetical protein